MFKGYKTIVIAIVAGLLALLETKEIFDVVPDSVEKLFGTAIAVLMFVMRFLTSSAVGSKE